MYVDYIRTNEGTYVKRMKSKFLKGFERRYCPPFIRLVSLKPNISMMLRNLSHQPAIFFALLLLCFAENVIAGWVRRPVMCCTSEPLARPVLTETYIPKLPFTDSLLLNFLPTNETVAILNEGDIELKTGNVPNAKILMTAPSVQTTGDVFVKGGTEGISAQLASLKTRLQTAEDEITTIKTEIASLDATNGYVDVGQIRFTDKNIGISEDADLITLASAQVKIGGTLGMTGDTTMSATLGVSRATTLLGTLSVSGATTMDSTLNVGSDFKVATDKFRVTAVNGNTVVGGNTSYRARVTTVALGRWHTVTG